MIVLVSIVVLGFVALAPQLQPEEGPKSAFSLQFVRMGGIAGTNDTFTVDTLGGATYSSRFGLSLSATLTPYELSHLKQELNTNLGRIEQKVFQPRGGAADYFVYALVVRLGDQAVHLSWVDEWASAEPFPAELRSLQQTLQDAIHLLSARATFMNVISVHADLPCGENQIAGLCGALTLIVFADKSSYKSGDEVQILVALSNMGAGSINYTSPTPCDPDIRITAVGGNRMQDLSFSEAPGQTCAQVLQPRSVGPNGTIVQRTTWNLMFEAGGSSIRAQPGVYVITVKFPFADFEPSLLEAALEIVVG